MMAKAEVKAVAKKASVKKSYTLEGLTKGSHLADGVVYKWDAGEIINCKTKKVYDSLKDLKAIKT